MALVLIAALSTSGCSLIDDLEDELNDDDEIVHCETGRSTEIYFSDAIHYKAAEQKWVFHNWKGSAIDGGCDIHINVHDAQITLTPAVLQAILSGATAWRFAIAATGVRCDTYMHFESQGDVFANNSPHIDLEFVGLLQGGDLAGTTVVTTSPATGQFTHVRIQLASELVIGSDTIAISESYYPVIITHEYGHAFGIHGYDGATGHSGEPEDVMFPTAECSALSAGDVATIRDVYTRAPYYTPAVSGTAFNTELRTIRVVCRRY
jgi:hypothetical protein